MVDFRCFRYLLNLHNKASYRCKPIIMEDREIIEREYLNEMAKYEQCRYRCKVLRKKGDGSMISMIIKNLKREEYKEK